MKYSKPTARAIASGRIPFAPKSREQPLQPNVDQHAVDPPLPPPQQTPKPLKPKPRPLRLPPRSLVRGGPRQRADGRERHVHHGAVKVRGAAVGDRRAGLEPVGGKVEEAPVRPVARGQEEDHEEEAAVDAWPGEEEGAGEEEEDEDRGRVGRDEEEGEPAGGTRVSGAVGREYGGWECERGGHVPSEAEHCGGDVVRARREARTRRRQLSVPPGTVVGKLVAWGELRPR